MPSSLRVLIAVETYPPDVNGAARFAERLAGGLAGRGHDVHVVAPSPSGPPSKVVHDGVTVHGVRSHSLLHAAGLPGLHAVGGRARHGRGAGGDRPGRRPHPGAHGARPLHGEGRRPHRQAAGGHQPLHAREPRRARARPAGAAAAGLPHRVEGPRPHLRPGRRGHRADPARGRAAAALTRADRRVPASPAASTPTATAATPSPTSPTCCSWAAWTRRSGSTS